MLAGMGRGGLLGTVASARRICSSAPKPTAGLAIARRFAGPAYAAVRRGQASSEAAELSPPILAIRSTPSYVRACCTSAPNAGLTFGSSSRQMQRRHPELCRKACHHGAMSLGVFEEAFRAQEDSAQANIALYTQRMCLRHVGRGEAVELLRQYR